MRGGQTAASKRYMQGLWNAAAKGVASGQDPAFSERDNPYKQFEHREFWLDGFRRARAFEKEKANEAKT